MRRDDIFQEYLENSILYVCRAEILNINLSYQFKNKYTEKSIKECKILEQFQTFLIYSVLKSSHSGLQPFQLWEK